MAEMLEHDGNMVGTWWSHAKDIERNMKVVSSGHGGAMDDHPGAMFGTCGKHGGNMRETCGGLGGTCWAHPGAMLGTCGEHGGNMRRFGRAN